MLNSNQMRKLFTGFVPVVFFVVFVLAGCKRRGVEPEPPPAGMFNLGDLAEAPEWDRLQRFQRSVTRDEFVSLLRDVYAEDELAWGSTMRIFETHVDIERSTHADQPGGVFRLYFANSAEPPPARPPVFWRRARDLAPSPSPVARPLEGARIVIDPGHIGCEWARMEERWFHVGEKNKSQPVMEGAMTLKVARHLRPLLMKLGAEVTLAREAEEPVTPLRPKDFADGSGAARARDRGVDSAGVPHSQTTVSARSRRLFYRTAEIRARARLINDEIRPDFVICLHFNASDWGGPGRPVFSPENHLHVLINGCYSAGEFGLDDQRFRLVTRLVQRMHGTEAALADLVAKMFADATALPPYSYITSNARRIDDNPYVYARNLLANRIYLCPVVFLEPYVMNNAEVYERVQAGDYEGEREVAGAMRPSIHREYARAVAKGVAEHYRNERPRGKAGAEK